MVISRCEMGMVRGFVILAGRGDIVLCLGCVVVVVLGMWVRICGLCWGVDVWAKVLFLRWQVGGQWSVISCSDIVDLQGTLCCE